MTPWTRRAVIGGSAVAVVAVGVVAVASGSAPERAATGPAPVATAVVERGTLSSSVSLDGILTYRAQTDGSPYTAFNQASGTYTALPAVGDEVRCGAPLYRVNDRPTLLLCGTVPAYRDLRLGLAGHDVEQLNRNLHRLGDDARAHVRLAPTQRTFSDRTQLAVQALQRRAGLAPSGVLAAGRVVVLPSAVRIAKVTALPGGAARPSSPVLQATSNALGVQVSLSPTQQGAVRRGDRARITLPGNRAALGRVDRVGRVATAPAGRGGGAATDATVPVSLSLDDPSQAAGFDRAPVQVQILTTGVDDVLSVPVTALTGRVGGGYAVDAVRAGGRRETVAVRLGLYDANAGRVQVSGALRAGDRVVVPAA